MIRLTYKTAIKALNDLRKGNQGYEAKVISEKALEKYISETKEILCDLQKEYIDDDPDTATFFEDIIRGKY